MDRDFAALWGLLGGSILIIVSIVVIVTIVSIANILTILNNVHLINIPIRPPCG